MTVKEYALRQLHAAVRQDPWVRSVLLAAGVQLDALAERIVALYDSGFFDRCDLNRLAAYEKALGLVPPDGTTEADRRAAVEGAWKSDGEVNRERFQEICNSWKNGEVVASYEPGVLHLTFNSIFGVPTDINRLKEVVNRVAPVHLLVDYAYRYLLIKEVTPMTLAELEGKPLNYFAGGA